MLQVSNNFHFHPFILSINSSFLDTKGTIYLTRKPSNFNSSVPASSASSNIETSSNMGKMKNSLQSPSPSIISSSKMSFLEGERDNVNGKDKEINDSNIPLNSNFSPFSLTNSSTMQSGATGNGSGTNPFISSQMKLMQSVSRKFISFSFFLNLDD